VVVARAGGVVPGEVEGEAVVVVALEVGEGEDVGSKGSFDEPFGLARLWRGVPKGFEAAKKSKCSGSRNLDVKKTIWSRWLLHPAFQVHQRTQCVEGRTLKRCNRRGCSKHQPGGRQR